MTINSNPFHVGVSGACGEFFTGGVDDVGPIAGYIGLVRETDREGLEAFI